MNSVTTIVLTRAVSFFLLGKYQNPLGFLESLEVNLLSICLHLQRPREKRSMKLRMKGRKTKLDWGEILTRYLPSTIVAAALVALLRSLIEDRGKAKAKLSGRKTPNVNPCRPNLQLPHHRRHLQARLPVCDLSLLMREIPRRKCTRLSQMPSIRSSRRSQAG